MTTTTTTTKANLRLASQFAIYILFNFCTLLLEVPLVRLFEQAICTRHLGHAVPDEASCKIPEVQDLLGRIVGFKTSFDALPGLLMAIYYGYLAEKTGCRVVLGLATAGYSLMLACIVLVCSFPLHLPVQLTWLASLPLFIGGGQRIFNSMVFTLTSSSLPPQNRTKYLFLLAAGPHFCRLITPRIAAFLMGRDILAPFWLAFGCFGVIACVIPFVDGATTTTKDNEYVCVSDREIHEEEEEEGEELPRPPINRNSGGGSGGRLQMMMMMIKEKLQEMSLLFDSPASHFCLAAFFAKRLGFASAAFVFQYASERFGWELKETTWLRVSSAVGAVLVTLVVGPLLNSFFGGGGRGNNNNNTNRDGEDEDGDGDGDEDEDEDEGANEGHDGKEGGHNKILDLWTIRASLAMLVASFLGNWLAPSVMVLIISMFGLGLGEALEPALQGFAIAATGAARNSLLFAAVAQCDALAELMGGPLMASLLAIGRTDGRSSDGLCFLASSTIFLCLFGWSCVI